MGDFHSIEGARDSPAMHPAHATGMAAWAPGPSPRCSRRLGNNCGWNQRVSERRSFVASCFLRLASPWLVRLVVAGNIRDLLAAVLSRVGKQVKGIGMIAGRIEAAHEDARKQENVCVFRRLAGCKDAPYIAGGCLHPINTGPRARGPT